MNPRLSFVSNAPCATSSVRTPCLGEGLQEANKSLPYYEFHMDAAGATLISTCAIELCYWPNIIWQEVG
jgi:hypothetical protein